MKDLQIESRSGKVKITVEMGDGPATLTGGLGGWKTIERVDDVAMTNWEGKEPVTQDVPVLLDGWGRNPQSVQKDLDTILSLGLGATVFKIKGPIHFEKKSWVLPDGGIDLGTEDTIRLEDGTLVRQSLTLHLMEHIRTDVIKDRGRAGKEGAIGEARPVTYTSKAGDNWMTIAAYVLGNWESWKEIAAKNPKLPKSPFDPIPGGTTVNL